MANGNPLTMWGTPQEDLQSMTDAYHVWIDQHRWIFKDFGQLMALETTILADAYQDFHIYLRIFGSTANGCKKAAAFIAAMCKKNPIVMRSVSKLSARNERCLALANIKAAYEIGESIAKEANHADASSGNTWNFTNHAKFPSIHSYIDFMVNLAKLGDELDKMPEEAVDQAITSIALIVELCFYHTNPDVAGRSDQYFWEKEILVESGKMEYGMLDFERNADDHVKVPGGYTPAICKAYPKETSES